MADPTKSPVSMVTSTIERMSGPKWQHKTTNGKYWVSTSDVMFSGWETMVFAVRPDGDIDYSELECGRYSNEDQAYWGHIKMFQKWDEKD